MPNNEIQYLINFVILPLVAIILSIFYFYYAYGYFSVVVLHRLTKASFKLDPISIFDLFISYFFALMAFLVIYYHIQFSIFQAGMDFQSSPSPNLAIFFGIILIYLGRIITKNLGVFYGKVHFSSIFLTSAVLILYRSISGIGVPEGIDLKTLYNYIITSLMYLIGGASYFLELYRDQIMISFFASIFLSTGGELFLSMMKPRERKLVSIMEKLPSGFLTYTGLHERSMDNIWLLAIFCGWL